MLHLITLWFRKSYQDFGAEPLPGDTNMRQFSQVDR